MGDAAHVARKIGDVRRAAPKASERSVRKGAQLIKADALTAIASITHGTFRLRGVRSRTTGAEARLGVRSVVLGSGESTTATIRATGPWQFIERDVSPHAVGTRAEANGQPPVMLIPGGSGFATGPWIAGGSQGKHPWRLSSKRSRKKVAKLYDEEVGRAIRTNF